MKAPERCGRGIQLKPSAAADDLNGAHSPVRELIDIPWKEIASFRDRAIHDYFQIDLQIAWDTITLDLEPLTKAAQAYLDAHP